MRAAPDPSRISIAVVLALFALLPVLAIFQYRWIGSVSAAERERMEHSLRANTTEFGREVNGAFNAVFAALQVGQWTRPFDLDALSAGLAQWKMSSREGAFVRAFYFIRPGEARAGALRRLDVERGQWTQVAWPPSLSQVKARLDNDLPLPSPFEDSTPAVIAIRGGAPPPGGGRPPVIGWTVAEIDLPFIQSHVLPGLVSRYFPDAGNAGYAVRIVSAARPEQVIFESAQGLPPQLFESPDLVMAALDIRPDRPPGRRPPPEGFAPPPPGRGAWNILVKHRSGSLEAAVAQARQRNLAISLTVLAILAASLTLLFFATRRAQRLTKLQMDFVAGISHELRTPLSVICSAAENLAHGVVTEESKVRHYGRLIEGEGRRLTGMVEQVLTFAGVQAGHAVRSLEPVAVEAVIEEALSACASQLHDSGIVVEKDMQSNLPPVLADRLSLGHCIGNLLSNAIKYSPDGKWLRVSASNGRSGLTMTVEDRGRGIDPEDLPHIFEPFYRGKQEPGNPVRGAGLGLSLVKRIVEAHGGRVTVTSAPGQGSRFTLTLPAAADGKP